MSPEYSLVVCINPWTAGNNNGHPKLSVCFSVTEEEGREEWDVWVLKGSEELTDVSWVLAGVEACVANEETIKDRTQDNELFLAGCSLYLI